MSELFSGKGSVDVPPSEKFGRKKGKYGRMAGAIIQALGGLSSTPGLTREERKDPNATGVIYNRERGLTREERKDPNATGVIYNRERGSKRAEAVEPRATFNPGISDKLKKRLSPDGGGMMIGGTSPIPGVSGHEYLNDPKYAEHRRDYYGKKKRVDKFGNPITKPEEDVKGKGRRRRSAERDRRRKVRKPSFRKDFDLSDRRKRTRRRMEGGNIPRDEQQPVGSGSTPYMPKVKFEDLIGIGKGKNKTNMPTFGKMELQ